MKLDKRMEDLVVLIRGAGEMASGVAHRLCQSHFKICLLEIPHPLAVRREVSFCEAIYEGEKEVEGVWAKLISRAEEIPATWGKAIFSTCSPALMTVKFAVAFATTFPASSAIPVAWTEFVRFPNAS